MNRDIAQKMIKTHLGAIENAKFQINEIAKECIPDFHFLNHEVSDFWSCDDSPIGWCVWGLSDDKGDLIPKPYRVCLYCGDPIERK